MWEKIVGSKPLKRHLNEQPLELKATSLLWSQGIKRVLLCAFRENHKRENDKIESSITFVRCQYQFQYIFLHFSILLFLQKWFHCICVSIIWWWLNNIMIWFFLFWRLFYWLLDRKLWATAASGEANSIQTFTFLSLSFLFLTLLKKMKFCEITETSVSNNIPIKNP